MDCVQLKRKEENAGTQQEQGIIISVLNSLLKLGMHLKIGVNKSV